MITPATFESQFSAAGKRKDQFGDLGMEGKDAILCAQEKNSRHSKADISKIIMARHAD
jgi:hypothetical protein